MVLPFHTLFFGTESLGPHSKQEGNDALPPEREFIKHTCTCVHTHTHTYILEFFYKDDLSHPSFIYLLKHLCLSVLTEGDLFYS